MKNPQIQEQFLHTSPQDELKELSYANSVEKSPYDNSKINLVSPEKFTIESWDVSQRLEPYSPTKGRYKDTLSTKLSTHLRYSKYRAQSAMLKKDIQNHNSHNFNSKSKNSINAQKHRSYLFFNSSAIQKYSPQRSLQKNRQIRQFIHQPSTQKIMQTKIQYKSKRSIETQRLKKNQQRMKTIQNYISHKKQQIIRQKDILYSQRTGKQQFSNIVIFPTNWSNSGYSGYNSSCLKNKKKRVSKKVNYQLDLKSIENKKSIEYSQTLKASPKRLSLSKKESAQTNSDSTKQSSPIKRFQTFLKKLNRYQNNQIFQ